MLFLHFSISGSQLHFNFNILIFIFLSLYIDDWKVPFWIVVTQIFFSLFTAQAWPTGAFAGLLLYYFILYTKSFFNLKGVFPLTFFCLLQQVIWGIIVYLLYSLRKIAIISWDLYALNFISSALLTALFTPWFFSQLRKIWKIKDLTPEEQNYA